MKTVRQIKDQAKRIAENIGKELHKAEASRIDCHRWFIRLNAVMESESRYLENIDNYLCALTGHNISKSEFFNTPVSVGTYTK